MLQIMTDKDLRELFPFLYNHRITSQNDVRIDALSQMYIAYNDSISVLACDNYVQRRKITRKIDLLYRMMDRSSVKGLLRMYRLTKDVMMRIYGPKDEECSKSYYKLLNAYMRHPSPDEELTVMQCIVYELGNIAGNNTEFDFYPWFQEKCRQWVSELNDEGRWPELPSETAVLRLQLLQDNSRVFRDTDLDSSVLRAYDYYRKFLIIPNRITAADLPLLGTWYDLLRTPDLIPYEPDLQKQIAQLLEDFAATVKPHSDAWYFATSYAVVQCCVEQIDRVQQELLLRPA